MERKDAEALVNEKLNEINDSKVRKLGGIVGLTSLTPFREFDSLDKTELIYALQDEGVPEDAVQIDGQFGREVIHPQFQPLFREPTSRQRAHKMIRVRNPQTAMEFA